MLIQIEKTGLKYDPSNCIKLTLNEVFNIMYNIKLIHLKYYRNSNEFNHEYNQFISNIGFTGTLSGIISFTLGEYAARNLTQRLIKIEDSNKITVTDIKDAMGELGNMIAVGIKMKMDELGISTKMTFPVVIYGKKLRILGTNNAISYSCEAYCEDLLLNVKMIYKSS